MIRFPGLTMFFRSLRRQDLPKRPVSEEAILIEFHKKLMSNMTETPPEFQKVLEEKFWELL